MKMCLHCMEQYADHEKKCPHCGYVPGSEQSSSGLPLECILEKRYLVGCVMHSGAEMISYIGWDEYLQCKVEIQEYYPLGLVCRDAAGVEVQLLSGSKQEEFRSGARRFLYEARRLVPYMHYSCMLKIIDAFQANRTIYIVRKYEKGQLLSEYLETKKIPEDKALNEINSVLDFLSSFHAGGMLIGDLSSERMLLTESGSLCISDCSQVIDIGTKSKQMEKATYNGFLPMEAASGEMTPVSDVYSAGALLYAMLTGEEPLPPGARLSTNRELSFPAGVPISEMTRTALHNALQPRAADRTQSTEQLRQELNGQGATRVVGGKVKEIRDTGNMKQWQKIAIAAAAALLVIVCILVGSSVAKRGSVMPGVANSGESLQVPDVVGKTVEEASKTMKKAGLQAEVIGRVYNKEVEAGQIFAQSVEPGKYVDTGTIIALTVCMGAYEQFELVNLVGMPFADVEAALREHFEVKTETVESNYEAGIICYQSQMPGLYDKYKTLTLYISAGIVEEYKPDVFVPLRDYVGMKYEDVQDEIAGLKVVLRTAEEHCPAEQTGLIIRQDPPAGDNIPEGTTLTLTIGIGPRSVLIQDYTARDYAGVKRELEEAGIIVRINEKEDDRYAAGLILEQNVRSGTKLEEGQQITLTVARKKAEESRQEERKITAANYVNMSREDAVAAIDSTINVVWEGSDDPAAVVISQTPSPGTELHSGDTVTLYLSEPAPAAPPQQEENSQESVPDEPGSSGGDPQQDNPFGDGIFVDD